MQQPYLMPQYNDDPPVKEERTFHRDMKLSQRHRDWGFDVPAVDIDFLEYDNGKAVALVEYKRVQDLAKCNPNPNTANMQALIDLGNRALVPVFCVFYTYKLKWYRVFPINELAKNQSPPNDIIPEQKYVDFLYWIRGRCIPEGIREKLW